MPSNKRTALCDDFTVTNRANRARTRPRSSDFLSTQIESKPHKHGQSHPYEDEVMMIHSLCEWYEESKSEKDRLIYLKLLQLVVVDVVGRLPGKPPTILCVPGLPRVEGKKCVYPDGTVRSLSEVICSHSKNAATVPAKSTLREDKF